jgi:hypothetical protein
MLRVDLHPEEFLERERAGSLDAEERARLDEHTAHCAACAFERRAARDFAELGEPFPGDAELVSRLVENTLSNPGGSRTRLRRVSSVRGRRPSRFARVALIAAAIFGSAIAAAAIWSALPANDAQRAPAEGSERGNPEAVRAASGTPRAAPLVVELEREPESAPSAAAADGEQASPKPSAATSAAPPRAVPAPSASATELSAAELFAAGNRARRGGNYAEAVRTYGELHRRFPGSREAHTSRVALGWMMLNQLGNPRGALAQFDGYLAGGGVLSEEARAGRALSLMRLGRGAEERSAWQELLKRHPSSVHAERARQRIESLGGR